MGCDIHMFAEKKVNGKWEQVGKIFENPYYSEDRESTVDQDGFEWNPKLTNQPYKARNYDLFAILADVRNGRGFAGVNTGEGFNPISSPKGLPKDISKELLNEEICAVGKDDLELSDLQRWVEKGYSKWVEENISCTNPDYHSHSWFTLKELKDYDWHQITMKRGTISLNQYKKLKENGGSPDGWSGSVGGENVITIDENSADLFLEGKLPDLVGKNIYVDYHWAITYSDHAQHFITDTIPTLEALGEPEDVRIVFWFDN